MESSATAAALHLVRTLKAAFIVSGLLFILVVYRVPAKNPVPANPAMEIVIAAIALSNIALGFLAPRFSSKLNRRSALTSQPPAPVQRWLSGCVLSLALFESCSLFAVVLHFVDANVYLVALLFAVGILSTIVWSPGNPPVSEDAAVTRY